MNFDNIFLERSRIVLKIIRIFYFWCTFDFTKFILLAGHRGHSKI